MTTQINVIVDAGGLADKAQAEAQARRLLKLEQEARAKAAKEGKQQKKAKEKSKGKPLVSQYRPEELTAQIFTVPLNLGHLWYVYERTTAQPGYYPLKRVHYGCGDGSQWLAFPESNISTGGQVNTEYAVFPSGTGNFILVALFVKINKVLINDPFASDPYYDVTYQYSIKSYAGSNLILREILLPSYFSNLQPVVGQLVPYRMSSGEVRYYQDYYYQSIFPGLQANDSLQVIGGAWTPTLFASLNAAHPFTASSSIKSFPLTGRQVVADCTKGGYRIFDVGSYEYFNVLYQNSESLYYAFWRNPGEQGAPWRSDSSQYYPTPLFRARPNLQFSATKQALPPSFPYDIGFDVIWDWNDPGYCQFMCKQLGFTDADLTP